MRNLLIVFILVILTSCVSFHRGSISSGPLLAANDRCVAIAEGHKSTYVVFGFGGGSPDALVHNVKREMEKEYPLKNGEYYANYTVDFKKTIIFFLVIKNEVYVHADILSQNSIEVTQKRKERTKGELEPTFYKSKTDSFYVGEKIYMNYDGRNQLPYTFKELQITGFDDKGFVYLEFIENSRTASVDKQLLYYSKDKERNGYKPGDEVNFKRGGKDLRGTILATSPTQVLISQDKGFYERKYSEIFK